MPIKNKKKYLLNIFIVFIAILFGFALCRFTNSYLSFEKIFENHKLLQRCKEDNREFTFLTKGGEYFPDYKNPRTLNDKIAYILHNYFYKSPITMCIGTKYYAKKYIGSIVGENHVAKLIGVWNNPEDIDWDKLPSRFVLKCVRGHFGNQVILVEDKNKINIHEVIKRLQDFCRCIRMQGMEITEKRIIAEEYLEQSKDSKGLIDYKFFYSYGKPIFAICYTYDKSGKYDHKSKESSCYSIPEWDQLPISVNNRKLNLIPKPKHFSKMLELAEKLSKPFPLIRVDFYEVGDRVIVGELTEDSNGAKYIFSPVIWDFKLGEMIDVPSLSEIDELIERDKKTCKLQEISDI